MKKIRVERPNGQPFTKDVRELPAVDEPLDVGLVDRVDVDNPPRNGFDAYVKLRSYPENP